MSEAARHAFVYERNRTDSRNNTEPLLDVLQVVKHLNLSRSMVYKLIQNGELKAIRMGQRAIRIPLSELEDYIERRKEEFDWE